MVENKNEELAVTDAAAIKTGIIIQPNNENSASYQKKGFRYGVYCAVKRVFDICSAGALFLALCVIPIIPIVLLVKWLEDIKYPVYKLEVTELGEGAEFDEKKYPNRYINNEGKVVEAKIVPVAKEELTKEQRKVASPVYTSKRVGKNGKIFNFYKIRSMCPGAEDMKQALIDAGLNESDGPAFKMKNDPRITKFGRIIRKYSLDELMQLLNIIKGDISVVGPRSPIPREVEEYTEYQKHRLDVKGGLLCLWQIQPNRNSLTFDEWVKLDIEYIQKQSFWLDLKIIFKGAWMVVFDHSGE